VRNFLPNNLETSGAVSEENVAGIIEKHKKVEMVLNLSLKRWKSTKCSGTNAR